MKKNITLLVLLLLCNIVLLGQEKEEKIRQLIEEGISYHDKGEYEKAIELYDKVLQLDKYNVLALAEKAMSLLELKKYNKAIKTCKTAIQKHPGDKTLKFVYVTYGTAYDEKNKPNRAIKIYNEGIQSFPDFYLLHFNKGITLTKIEKYEEAEKSFQKSVSLNPEHPSSHYYLGSILHLQNKRIPALLAYSRFLILEPESNRSQIILENLQKVMKGNVEQKDKNSITINVSADMLTDTINGKKKENNFSTTELVLAFDVTFDYIDSIITKPEVEKFVRKFNTLCKSLKETQKNNYGFYWTYYAPYFIEMMDKDLVETFAYIAFATSNDPSVSKWIESHKDDIKKFYQWSDNFQWEHL